MKFLILGDTGSLAISVARYLIAEKHQVILAGTNVDKNLKRENILVHNIEATDTMFQKVMAGFKIDSVVFFSPREENQNSDSSVHSASVIDGLINTLEFCRDQMVQHFYLVSSTEVYGTANDRLETSPLEPASINGLLLKTIEEYCQYFNNQFNLPISLVRVPNVYGADETTGLLNGIITSALDSNRIIVNAPKEDFERNFLHVNDLADFLHQASQEESSPELQTFNLQSTDTLSIKQLETLLSKSFPSLSIEFAGNENQFTRPAEGEAARTKLGWFSRQTLRLNLPDLIEAIRQRQKAEPTFWQKFRNRAISLQPLIKWVELILGAALVQHLNSITNTLVQFKFVDFRLLFVVVMGSVHGFVFGLLSAVIASLSALLSWYQLGLDWDLLIYNPENWLPFAIYLTAGAVTGYMQERRNSEQRFQEQQKKLLNEKYQFLYGVYNDIREIKNQYRDQLMGYRDSFGRIYNITRELDTLQEADILLRALNILEDVMENENIAIYAIDSNFRFARLQITSRKLRETLGKSLQIDKYPLLKEKIESREIFQNTALDPDYPAYFVPITNGGKIVAGIAIWKANFEQYTLNYFNLLKVISGLIQSSLVRATLFNEVNEAQTMYPNTRILKPEPFKQLIDIHTQMKDTHVSDFSLLRVISPVTNMEDFYQRVSKGIRTVDAVGKLTDDNYYILLSQTASKDTHIVTERLVNNGIEALEITLEAA